MKLFGMESHYNNYTINAIYENNENQIINLENMQIYFTIIGKTKQKDEFQNVDATHEFYLLEKEYVNELESKQFDNFYSFKRPSNFVDKYWEKVDNKYFQPLPKSVEKFIEENLKLIEKK